jgi:hypothetical protein
MLKAPERGASIAIDGRDDSFGSIVTDLISLIGHVQASINLIEAAIVREGTPGDQDNAVDVVVLDDVTPCYAKANAALIACNVSLSTALQSLLDTSRQFMASERASATKLEPRLQRNEVA